MLRWDSYVNIRHVYKVEKSHLKEYTNADTPNTKGFRFERESMIRMLAKGKTLTMYEPGPQVHTGRASPAPARGLRDAEKVVGGEDDTGSPVIRTASIMSLPNMSLGAQEDFRVATPAGDRIPGRVPKVPPDAEKTSVVASTIQDGLVRPAEQFIESVRSLALVASNAPAVIRQPLYRAWRDLKGVIAIAIASL